MKKKGISMDKIREIIRLSQKLNLGCRKIAAAINISKTAANDYIQEFKATGLSYEDIKDMSDCRRQKIMLKIQETGRGLSLLCKRTQKKRGNAEKALGRIHS